VEQGSLLDGFDRAEVGWSGAGPLSSWYVDAGGPLALWRAWGDDVQGRALAAGHFFPEEIPAETADALEFFFHARP
jgi:haloacetate dehalogenase